MISVEMLYAAAAVVGTLLVAYAFFVEPYRVEINRIDVMIENLPDALEGFTICHLSDIHATRYGRFERLLGRMLSRIQADLCVITGDLVNSQAGIGALARLLEGFKPRFGIFAVPGNNDHSLRMPIAWLSGELEKLGVNLLVNSSHAIRCGGLGEGECMYLIGVDDPFRGLDEPLAASSGISGRGIRILLAHSPDVLMKMGGLQADLILAGHTHGGQVRIPLVGPIWLHCRHRFGLSDGYFDSETLSRVSGKDIGRAGMYVSRGLRGSGVRARFLCLPEIALVTLRPRFRA